jgi:hypothetical protein
MKIENRETNEETSIRQHSGHLEEHSPKHIRVSVPLISLPKRNMEARAYLRGLRAAEMAAWELTGGDYLLSRS